MNECVNMQHETNIEWITELLTRLEWKHFALETPCKINNSSKFLQKILLEPGFEPGTICV